ncbi:succinyl-diaminopimelate desuccinylase [soil metagenome]
MAMRGYDGRDWEPVRTFHRRWEAEMVQGFLEANGFSTWLLADDAGGSAYPGVTLAGQVLLVPSEDVDRARELVAMGGAVEDGGEQERERLVRLLMELLRIPSVTGEEEAIADWLEDRYVRREEVVRRVGDSLVVGEEDFERANVLLVAHVDVVPPAPDDPPEPAMTSERVVGRGASDMKSGLAVAMECFEDPALRAGPYNLLLVCYAGEEGTHAGNQLRQVLEAVDELNDADLAIVLEPTDLAVQLGCLGGLHAELIFRGKAAHSARPWHGENALTKAGELLDELHARAPQEVDVDGLVYREVFTATQGHTPEGVRNVVPDLFTVNLNYRYAPTRRLTEAEERVWELVRGRAEVVFTDRSPPAPPSKHDPCVAAFLKAVGAPVEPKQAWTDVARFAEAEVPALNYGPGLTAQAHQAGEYVPISNMVTARAALGRFLSGQGDTGTGADLG